MPIRELITRDGKGSSIPDWWKSPWVVFVAVQFIGIVLGYGSGPHGDPTVWLGVLLLLPGVLALIPLGSLPESWLGGGELLGIMVIVTSNAALFWAALKVWRKYF